MKQLFRACQNYPETWDGHYFKHLRESLGYSRKTLSSLALRTKCPLDERGIQVLEDGKFQTWHRQLALEWIEFLQPLVLQSHGVGIVELPAAEEKAKEKEIRRHCKLLGFKYAKYPRSSGGWRYRLTHLDSELCFNVNNELSVIVATVEAAMKEIAAEKASATPGKKQVEIFDPFDL